MTQNERQRSGDSELLRREDPKPQTRRHSQRQWQHAKETRASPNVVRLLSEECLLRRDISSLQDSLFRLRALTVLVRLCYQKRLPDIVSRTCHQTMRVMHGRPIFIVLLVIRSEEHTSELQSHVNLVCRLLLEKKNQHHDDHQPCHVEA